MSYTSSQTLLQTIKEHVYRDYESLDSVAAWRKLPEIPTSEEIMGTLHQNDSMNDSKNKDLENLNRKQPILPVNIVDGPWESIESYVGSHYQLLREDAVAPLRNAVALFKAQPSANDYGDLSIYTHVRIVGMTFSSQGPAPRIEFSYERAGKRIRWKQSKRLQQGTIIALTPTNDKFKKICKVAVVAARPLSGVEQNPPQIDIFWGDTLDAAFDPLEEYIMIEARSGYFEASRHMLVAMQKLMTESFPLSEYLVDLENLIDAPDFIKNQPRTNLNSLTLAKKPESEHVGGSIATDQGNDTLDNVDILGQWPEIDGSSLDESQMAALRRIITKKLATVQGPPGTGKTFTSVSALKVMLGNLGSEDPPIIVAAQTNHALDQLLNLIAPTEPNFLRLGGRTTGDNVMIRARTMHEIMQLPRQVNGGALSTSNIRNSRKALEVLAKQIQYSIDKAIRQETSEPMLLLELNIISKEQYDSLHDDDWISDEDPELPSGVIALWLGHEQIMTAPCCPLINMGFEEEDDPEFEALEEAEIEIGKKDDEDIDQLAGEWFPIKESFIGRPNIGVSEGQVIKLLATKDNLWDINPNMRGEVYRYLRRQLKCRISSAMHDHFKAYRRLVQNLKVARWQSHAMTIKKEGIKLIGCTTTGLSKYRGLLSSLQPRTLFIEEAAETLEGTILAAMFNCLQQLILVGDHQQLQANCNISALSKPPYNLSVSMFERLVNNGLEYTMLNKQRRMIPEIRELLNPFYPQLQDHHSVLDRLIHRKPIPGMGGRDSYFFHHQWLESRDDALSRYNADEAEMIACFFTYLMFNGVEPSKITVLTFYNGQRKEILKKLRRQPELISHGKRFNVFTVDSYQGEENDIILLSLVRSNNYHNIGFLDNKNRAVVALSRARRGLYIFGNSINLLAANSQSYQLWSSITDLFRKRRRLDIDNGLPIVCSNHRTETVIEEPIDWRHLTGGCVAKCHGKLPCGHPCPYKCHPFRHEDILCRQPCRLLLPCGHGCTARCGNSCRCLCDIPAKPLKKNGELHDEMWQASLDDVLGDVNQERPVSQDSASSGALMPDSSRSSPRKWREWDAKKADRDLDDVNAANRTATASSITIKPPIFKEIHRPVTIQDGSRVRKINGATTTLLDQKTLNPVYQVPQVSTFSNQSTEMAGLASNRASGKSSTADEFRLPSILKFTKEQFDDHTPLLDLIEASNTSLTTNSPPYSVRKGSTSALHQQVSTSARSGLPTPRQMTTDAKSRDLIEDEEDLISFD